MAIVATVTKKSVVLVMPGQWIITINLSCADGEAEVINKDVSFDYKTGDNIGLKNQYALIECQKIIDKYKAEQSIYNNALFDNLVTYVNTNLEE